VLAATRHAGVLIFLMSGTGGLFSSKIKLKSYFDNANGCVKAHRCVSPEWTSET